MATTPKSWSTKQLCYIFLGSLTVFTILRWDINMWLSRQLDAVLVQNHIQMQYQSLSLHGSGFDLSNVALHIPNLPNKLLLDTVQSNLDWAALWHGHMALKLMAKNPFIQFKSSLSFHNHKLGLNHISTKVNIKPAQSWLEQSTLLQASGQAILQGSLHIDIQTGLPTPVNLQMLWQHASINLLGKHYMLGDYSLQLNDQNWLLQGGKQLQLNGKGSLTMNAHSIFQWPLQGEVQMYSKESAGVAAILPSNKVHMSFTGTLGSPHWVFQ